MISFHSLTWFLRRFFTRFIAPYFIQCHFKYHIDDIEHQLNYIYLGVEHLSLVSSGLSYIVDLRSFRFQFYCTVTHIH